VRKTSFSDSSSSLDLEGHHTSAHSYVLKTYLGKTLDAKKARITFIIAPVSRSCMALFATPSFRYQPIVTPMKMTWSEIKSREWGPSISWKHSFLSCFESNEQHNFTLGLNIKVKSNIYKGFNSKESKNQRFRRYYEHQLNLICALSELETVYLAT